MVPFTPPLYYFSAILGVFFPKFCQTGFLIENFGFNWLSFGR